MLSLEASRMVVEGGGGPFKEKGAGERVPREETETREGGKGEAVAFLPRSPVLPVVRDELGPAEHIHT